MVARVLVVVDGAINQTRNHFRVQPMAMQCNSAERSSMGRQSKTKAMTAALSHAYVRCSSRMNDVRGQSVLHKPTVANASCASGASVKQQSQSSKQCRPCQPGWKQQCCRSRRLCHRCSLCERCLLCCRQNVRNCRKLGLLQLSRKPSPGV